MKRIFFVLIVVFGCFLLLVDSIGAEPEISVQIICEIGSQDEIRIDFAERNDGNFLKKEEDESLKLKNNEVSRASSNKNSFLEEDGWDILKESTKAHEFREAEDARKIAEDLSNELVRNFMKKGIFASDADSDYQVFLKVQEISYDDFKGIPYVKSIYYNLKRNQEIIYQNTFSPKKKRYLFGGGEYTYLVKVEVVASEIVSDLYNKLKK